MSILKLKRTLNSKLIGQSLLGMLFNGFGILFSVVTIAILIKYLGKENYGFWITIFAICNWINFLDGGLGNSLRNELTVSLLEKNKIKAKALISTAYIGIFIFLILLFCIILIVHTFIDWNFILKNNAINYNYLAIFLFGFFLLQMVFKILSKIYFSFEKPYMSFLIPAITNLFICLFVYSLYSFEIGNTIWNVALVYSFVPLIVLIFLSVHFFHVINPEYKPNIRSFNKKYVKVILMGGVKFFFIQMNSGLLQALTPFFITLWFTAELTTEYHISIKYYSLLLVLFNIILQTMWGSMTKSYSQKKKKEMVSFFFNSIKISSVFVFVLIVMCLLSENIYRFWLGNDILISPNINFASAIFVLITIISKTFTNILNATNNIKIQTPISLIILALYIPSIYLAVKFFELGVLGLILTPAIFFLAQATFAIYELRKILTRI